MDKDQTVIAYANLGNNGIDEVMGTSIINEKGQKNNYGEEIGSEIVEVHSEEELESLPKALDLDTDRDCDVVEYKCFKNLTGKMRIQKLLEIIDLNHLSNPNHTEIFSMIKEFNQLFFIEGDELTFTKAAIHEIETTTNIPINERQYRMPEATKIHIDEQIDEM